MHPAQQYAECGFHIIPITPGDKTPSILLPERKWGLYQTDAAPLDVVLQWIKDNPDGNWALICGNGVACGDCDDLDAAAWILADPHRPLFQGACIVRSGHGKAHIWFRYSGSLKSSKWHMLPGIKMGEIRAEGNYVVVPPSTLADGGAYTATGAGRMNLLPTITDPAQFLGKIVEAYLADRPRASEAPKETDTTIVASDSVTLSRVRSRIARDKFKKTVTDTLFIRGKQGWGPGEQ